MCNCISEIEKKALAMFVENKRFAKPVRSVRLNGVVFPVTDVTITVRTSNMLEVELEGQKKRPTVTMTHNFCPFCGEKYEKPEQSA